MNLNSYTRGLLTGVGLIAIGILLGQSAASHNSPIPANLNQFFPRAQDLFHLGFEIEPSGTLVVLTVPPGKVFVLTRTSRSSNDNVVAKKNDEVLRIWEAGIGTGEIMFSFLPGDVFSMQNLQGSRGNGILWGYWADHAP